MAAVLDCGAPEPKTVVMVTEFPSEVLSAFRIVRDHTRLGGGFAQILGTWVKCVSCGAVALRTGLESDCLCLRPGPTRAGCVTLGELLHLSGPPRPHLEDHLVQSCSEDLVGECVLCSICAQSVIEGVLSKRRLKFAR